MIRLWDKNYEKRISDRKDESFWDVIEEIYFLNLTELWYGYICLCVYVQILWIWTDNLSHFSILQRGSNKLLKIQEMSIVKKSSPLNIGWQSFPPAKTPLDSCQRGESGLSNKVFSSLVSSQWFLKVVQRWIFWGKHNSPLSDFSIVFGIYLKLKSFSSTFLFTEFYQTNFRKKSKRFLLE